LELSFAQKWQKSWKSNATNNVAEQIPGFNKPACPSACFHLLMPSGFVNYE
jgi:hypothetical protein